MLQQASTAWVGLGSLVGRTEYPFDILLTNARYSLLTYSWEDVFRLNNSVLPLKDSPWF